MVDSIPLLPVSDEFVAAMRTPRRPPAVLSDQVDDTEDWLARQIRS